MSGYPYDDPKEPRRVADNASGSQEEPEAEEEHDSGEEPSASPVAGPKADPYGLGPTSMGVAAHVLAGVSYLLWPLAPLVIFLMERENRFARFHALQSLILGLGWIPVAFLGFVLGYVPIIGLILMSCVYLAFFALVLWGLVSGFTGQWTRLPVVGEMAAQQLKLDG
ncbi:MAG: DUF4870 domain-containing protein [Armatimonadetes bacterium]|nr:MAG: DUF4870 domain-containing protein [Armatimonadota bacterium]